MPTNVLVMRLLLAAGLGAALGLEREYHRKPAGLRTNMLIAIGSAMFTIVSIQLGGPGMTPDRVASQIVTGIGFLGAGAILRGNRGVHGLTTAATIWVNASIGMAVGAGLHAIAAVTTAVTLVILGAIRPLEGYLERRAKRDGAEHPRD